MTDATRFSLVGLRGDRFFRWASIVIVAIAAVGFAKSFYARPLFETSSLNLLLQAHGAAMTAWLLLFAAQAQLIAVSRVRTHRTIGLAGIAVAAVVAITGAMTLTFSVERRGEVSSALDFVQKATVSFGLSLVAFAVLVTLGLLCRHRADAHKRLLLLASVCLLPPAVVRAMLLFVRDQIELLVMIFMTVFVVALVAIDAVRNRRLHPVMAWGGASVIAIAIVTYYVQTHG